MKRKLQAKFGLGFGEGLDGDFKIGPRMRGGHLATDPLVACGDHDGRVHPTHAYKYTAAFQAGQGGKVPILIRVEIDSGHGAGLALTKFVERESDVLGFLAKHLELPE